MTTKTKSPAKGTTEEVTAITVLPINIDPKLPESRRDEILPKFLVIYKQIQELEPEYASITQADVTVFGPKIAKRAREARLKCVGLRGKHGLKGVHTEMKEDVKLEGQVIDYLEREPRTLLLEWEAKLEEIELFQEREEERRIAELQTSRAEMLKPYEPEEELDILGEMTDERWEEYFMNTREIFRVKKELEEKTALRNKRKDETAPYSLLITDYSAITWEELTEKRFQEVLSGAKKEFEKREAERLEYEAKVAEMKTKAEEAERLQQELDRRFSKRVSLISGAELKEDGIYYADKKIATLKSVKETSDAVFEVFLDKHLLKYNSDKEDERVRLEQEAEAKRKQEETRIQIEADRRVIEERRKKAAEDAKTEEENLLKARREAEEKKKSPYPNQLREYAKAWAALEIPVPSSNDFGSNPTYNTLKDMIQRGIAYVESQADKIEGVTEEKF
jgi:hypothetical protein